MNTCNVHHLMQQYDYAVMLSAELTSYGEVGNKERTARMEHELKALGLRYERALGCYKGVKELSFLVYCDTYCNVTEMVNIALHEYTQDSALVLDARKSVAMLQYARNIEIIGRALVEVEEEQALACEAYTIIDGDYWTIQ